ncbi:adenine nucleotide alpha hydrolases-like protein [Xylaria telfairii]|nr:adenine nucleotide alpha hydrolases-like protein [Xylaria telfairii]
MGTLLPVLHTGARPISIHEFAEALRAICPPRFPTERTNVHRSVALAVSGGVDSMALAYLCSRLRRHYLNFSIADNPVGHFRAIVVDHGLREGSAIEAKAVAKALAEIDVNSSVCSISWTKHLGHHKHPKELTNFESVARRLRYQALAKTCTMFDIASLLFAHHQDDQYETVLMRLLQGHGARGLRGMRAASDIPECEDLHLAHRSGYTDDQKRKNPYYNTTLTKRQYRALKHDMASRIDYHLHKEELRGSILEGRDRYHYQAKRARALELPNVDVEDGGIMVYRPLLEFSKDRLIATCEANNIRWWEDGTNNDPTLTMRNAVRHMCRNHTLPVALQKPSILALSRRCEQRAQALEAEADRLLARTIIHDFKPNVGSALVQFPEYGVSRFPRDKSSPVRRRARIQRQREVAGLLIKRIIALVSPEEQPVPLANLQNVISWLFPALSSDPTPTEPPKAFGIAGVHLVPIESSARAGNTLTWYLSRTPYPTHQPMPRYRTPYWSLPRWSSPWGNSNSSTSRDPVVGGATTEEEGRGRWRWSHWRRWTLWDGRFWFRIRHRLPYRVILQPFLRDHHAAAFRAALAPRDRDRLAVLLKHYAPGKTRYTLPALYLEEDLDLENVVPRPYYPVPPCVMSHIDIPPAMQKPGARWNTDPTSEHPRVPDTMKMRLVGLPSLDVQVPRLNDWLECEIRYRSVDRNTMATAGSFHRGSFLAPRSRHIVAMPTRPRRQRFGRGRGRREADE